MVTCSFSGGGGVRLLACRGDGAHRVLLVLDLEGREDVDAVPGLDVLALDDGRGDDGEALSLGDALSERDGRAHRCAGARERSSLGRRREHRRQVRSDALGLTGHHGEDDRDCDQ